MDITLRTYKYVPTSIELTLDKNYTLESGVCTYLNITHDYLNRRFPVMQIGIELPSDMIKLVYQYKNTAVMKLEVNEYQYDADNNLVSSRQFLRKTLTIIPVNAQTTYITATDSITESESDIMKKLQVFDMFLIDMIAINWFNQQISVILQNTSKPAALQALFHMRNIPAKTVIATPPLDTQTLNQFILPPGNLIDNIDVLNRRYGIYNSYPIIYYDFNFLYCINKVAPNIVIPSSVDFDTVTFILKNISDPSHLIYGSGIDQSSKTHYTNLQSAPTINDKTIQSTTSKFSTLATVDYNGNVSKTTLDANSTALIYETAHNSYTSDQIINEIMSGPVLTISTYNAGISFMTPYKTYLLIWIRNIAI